MSIEKSNRAMAELLHRARSLHAESLDSELAAYLKDGVALQSDGAVESVAAARGAHVSRGQFADRVAYEAFVNKIHLDDWCSDVLADATVEEKLAQALLLADAVGESAQEHHVSIAVVISVDPDTSDVVFRFHGVRAGDAPWLAAVDEYAEPILLRLYSPGISG